MNLINEFLSKALINLESSSFTGELALPHRDCILRKEVILIPSSTDSSTDTVSYSISLIDNSIGGQILFKLNLNGDADFISAEVSGEMYTSLDDFYEDAGESLLMIIDEFDGE